MKVLLTLAAVGLLAMVSLWERKETGRLSSQNETLRAAKAEADQLAAENAARPKFDTAPGDTAAPTDKSELLRLRNEIRQLRAQLDELGKLRAANERLAADLKSGRIAPRRITDLEGTVPREQWKFVGLATPEATVQSFFAAVLTGNPEEVIRCATPQAQEQFRRQMEANPEQFQKQFFQEFKKLGQVNGFRIERIHHRAGGGDQIEVLVQVAVDGATMPLPLRRIGEEWRLGD